MWQLGSILTKENSKFRRWEHNIRTNQKKGWPLLTEVREKFSKRKILRLISYNGGQEEAVPSNKNHKSIPIDKVRYCTSTMRYKWQQTK
jgi:hypothetical protein